MAVGTNLLPPRYRGAQRIGRGGMGEVFRATDDQLGRAVAVKVLAERYTDDEGIRAGSLREALAAARLSGHPHTVTIFDVGEWDGRPFIVMEYLAGGTLADRLRRGAVAARRGARVARPGRAGRSTMRTGTASSTATSSRPTCCSTRDGSLHVGDFGIASAAGHGLADPDRDGARHRRLPLARAGRGWTCRRRRATATHSASSPSSSSPGGGRSRARARRPRRRRT